MSGMDIAFTVAGLMLFGVTLLAFIGLLVVGLGLTEGADATADGDVPPPKGIDFDRDPEAPPPVLGRCGVKFPRLPTVP